MNPDDTTTRCPLKKLFRLGVAILTDIATLGGAVNDGYFANGKRTYTQKEMQTK
jgi:hypothetical protein